MSLNLKDFKKISSTEHHSLFQNKHGHQIKIAHKALSDDLRSQLNGLPKFSHGGEIHKYKGGGDTVGKDTVLADDGSQDTSQTPDVTINMTPPQYGSGAAQGMSNEPPAPAQPQQQMQAPSLAQLGKGISPDDVQPAKGTDLAQALQPGSSLPGNQAPPGVPTFASQSADNNTPDQISDQQMQKMPGAQTVPANSPENPISSQGQTATSTLPPPPKIPHNASPDQVKAAHVDDLTKETQAVAKDIMDGHITPKTMADWYGDKSTTGKIGAFFGLLLSGMGSGLTHQPNMLLGMIQNQLDNDFKAQTANKTNKLDFLKVAQQGEMNRAQIKNMNMETSMKAQALARTTQNMAALHGLVQYTYGLPQGSPQRQQAEQVLGSLSQAVQGQNYNIIDQAGTNLARLHAITGGQGSNVEPAQQLRQMQVMGYIDPKQYEQANKELEKHQEVDKLRNDFMGSWQDLNGKVLAGKFSPQDQKSASQAFAGPMAKMAEGRFNLQEAENQSAALLPGIEGDDTRQKKFVRAHQFFDSFDNHPTLDGLGIKLGGGEQQQMPGQSQTKKMGGVTYQKVPGGWKRSQ